MPIVIDNGAPDSGAPDTAAIVQFDTDAFNAGEVSAAGAVDSDYNGGYIDPVYRQPRNNTARYQDPLLRAANNWLRGY